MAFLRRTIEYRWIYDDVIVYDRWNAKCCYCCCFCCWRVVSLVLLSVFSVALTFQTPTRLLCLFCKVISLIIISVFCLRCVVVHPIVSPAVQFDLCCSSWGTDKTPTTKPPCAITHPLCYTSLGNLYSERPNHFFTIALHSTFSTQVCVFRSSIRKSYKGKGLCHMACKLYHRWVFVVGGSGRGPWGFCRWGLCGSL